MKLLKKILFIVSGLIVFIAIGLCLFLRLRESRAKNSLVHRDSEYVVKVSVDKILTDIAWNAVMNPGYYTAKDTTDRSSIYSVDRSELGVRIPAHIYMFALKDSELTLYSLLDVEDEHKWLTFIRKGLGEDALNVKKEADIWWVSNKDNRISYLWDTKNVLVALSLDKTDKKAQMMDIWTQRADCMLPIKTLGDFNFENNNADIMWKKRNAESTGSLSFMTGNIISDFSFPNNRLRLPEEVKVRRLPESNILNVYCQADLSALFEKYKHNLVRYNIPADTLKKYYGGYLDVQWRDEDVLQADSIVTYDYDDNFNTIEKKDIRREAVPNLLLTFKASPHLADYLPQKMFYKFYKIVGGDHIGLGTDSQFNNEYPYMASDKAIYLSYQYDVAVQRHLGWVPELNRVHQIRVEGKGKRKSNIFHLTVQLKERKIHALYQLVN